MYIDAYFDKVCLKVSQQLNYMKKTILLLLISFLIVSLQAQQSKDLLKSGPMVGYADMQEVMLWVQTRQSEDVYISYSPIDSTDKVYYTDTVKTDAHDAFCAHLLADKVEPGIKYIYKLFIGGKELSRSYDFRFQTPPLWQYRTDPPEMNIALGSCTYINEPQYDRPGKPYGGEYQIFEAIHKMSPDMMLWLGDNTYLREPDWGTRSGIFHRYSHSRDVKEMQPLLASTSNYAIWDDHDYGPNDSDRSFIHSDFAMDAFKAFWANPSYGMNGEEAAITAFSWGDADFFMLDNRSFRTPNRRDMGDDNTVLGKEQLEWIIDALCSSRAKFKFVCIGGQVLNSVARFENYINLASEERRYLLDEIVKAKLRNVIFLTGDRHHSELSKYEQDGVVIYDFTVSPLTSGSHDASDEPNTYRVEGSHVGIRNFGMMNISGPRRERVLKMSLYDNTGKQLWDYTIEAK